MGTQRDEDMAAAQCHMILLIFLASQEEEGGLIALF
jgi:hypothetical protein